MGYFRLDTVRVKECGVGGRLFSARPKTAKALPNGVLGYLGAFETGKDEIRELLVPDANLIKTEVPVIVTVPEINYKQDSATDAALGTHINGEGKVLRVAPLSKYDEISLSKDYFDVTGKSGAIAVGDIFTIQANSDAGLQLKYSATAPANTAAKVYFKVTEINKSHVPCFLGGDGKMFPAAYEMIDVEMIFA